jgi:hypothetical protein
MRLEMDERDYDKNVYILGAGFSASAKAPLLKDFLDRSKDLLANPRSKLSEEEREMFHRVFEYKDRLMLARDRIKIDLNNIEELFGLVEMEYEIGEKEGNKGIAKIRDNLIYMIVKTLELTIDRAHARRVVLGRDAVKENEERYPGVKFRDLSIYEYFILMISRITESLESGIKYSSDTIITFNYDLIADNSIHRCGMISEYGDGGSSSYPGRRPINLLKLHGSANWSYCTEPTCGWTNIEYDTEKVDMANLLRRPCPRCQKNSLSPLIVPPTWNKSKYHIEILADVWKKALHELKLASRVVVIGYSMPSTDTFFKYLLTVALSSNPTLKEIVVINKGEDLKEIYSDFMDDFFIEHGSFYFTDNYFQEFVFDAHMRERINRSFISPIN